jgi:DNA polymerase-3 subunit delta'
VIIDSAHALNPQAGNALLKILEEPPPDTHFFLITAQASSLLPTIRSRAQAMRFAPLSDDDLAGALSTLAASDPVASAAAWSQPELAAARGSVEEALRLRAESESSGEIRQAVADLLGAPKEAFPSEGLARLREVCDERGKAMFAARAAQEMARDLSRQAIASSDRPRARSGSAARFPPNLGLALRLSEFGLAAERDLAGNVDRQLVFENLWFDWNRARMQTETIDVE